MFLVHKIFKLTASNSFGLDMGDMGIVLMVPN